MLLKPIKRGIKTWMRSDSFTGYTYDFNIYTGRETDHQDTTLGERVIRKLVSTTKKKTSHFVLTASLPMSTCYKTWNMQHSVHVVKIERIYQKLQKNCKEVKENKDVRMLSKLPHKPNHKCKKIKKMVVKSMFGVQK